MTTMTTGENQRTHRPILSRGWVVMRVVLCRRSGWEGGGRYRRGWNRRLGGCTVNFSKCKASLPYHWTDDKRPLQKKPGRAFLARQAGRFRSFQERDRVFSVRGRDCLRKRGKVHYDREGEKDAREVGRASCRVRGCEEV